MAKIRHFKPIKYTSNHSTMKHIKTNLPYLESINSDNLETIQAVNKTLSKLTIVGSVIVIILLGLVVWYLLSM